MSPKPAAPPSVRAALRVTRDRLDLAAIDAAETPVGPGSKSKAAVQLAEIGRRLDRRQEELFAEGASGGRRRVLLVLQGMDTSGKSGTIRHVAGLVSPQGLHIAAFKKPTKLELRHDFLWRIRKQVPGPGYIGVFDRSHYEDVLVARVDRLVPATEWRRRFTEINQFEAELAEQGVTVVKCLLHISAHEQRERLLARLDDPVKYWKHNPGDVDARRKWSAYQRAYTDVLRRCSTETAPWYVVPADRKWYRNWAIANLLLETLDELDPQYPEPSYDIEIERARLTAGDPVR